jgi:ribosomal protein L32
MYLSRFIDVLEVERLSMISSHIEHGFYPDRISYKHTSELHAKVQYSRNHDPVGYIGSWYMQVLKTSKLPRFGVASLRAADLSNACSEQGCNGLHHAVCPSCPTNANQDRINIAS